MTCKTKIGFIVFVVAIATVAIAAITIAENLINSAYAQTVDTTTITTSNGIISHIVSSEVVILALGITVTGIALKAIVAVMKHGKKEYNYRMTIVSLILGFLVSLQMVTTSMEHLPDSAPGTVYLTIIIGEILTVMGIDSGAKAVGTKLGLNGKTTSAEGAGL